MKIKTIAYMGLFRKDLFEIEEVVDQSIHGNLELFGVSLYLSFYFSISYFNIMSLIFTQIVFSF